MSSDNTTCSSCLHTDVDKGRAPDGRRVYRCRRCANTWTCGLQGKQQKWSKQRLCYQFADTGASKS